MSTQANQANLLVGRGKLYFDRYVNGVPTGIFRFLGDCSKLEVTPSSTEKERYTMTKAAAPLMAMVTTQQVHKVTIDAGEFTKENVAIALFGTSSSVTQATTAVTAENVFTGVAGTLLPDAILRLKNRNVPFTGTGALVLTATPTATLVLGTDYEVEDAEMGLIYILPTCSTVATITGISAAYTPAASTFNRVAAGLDVNIHGVLVFKGDPANGPAMEVEVWNLRIKPAAAIALIVDDFGMITLEGQAIDDSINHPLAPLYQITYR
jgi:hypothetical protein